MLYIKEGEDVVLPKKYHSINNICAVIYDQLTEILVDENYKDLTYTTFQLDKVSQDLIEEYDNSEVHPLDWLKENKLNKELTTILTKHITMSVLADFVNFMYESLSCARKGKMSVAYALLRKPMTDELLMFEQILSDKDEFVNRFFHNGNPALYDPSPTNKNLDKESIIRDAYQKLKVKCVFNHDIIYKVRYDKAYPPGINGITNRAIHIVTNDSNYKSTNQNLNFVFSNSDDLETYYKHYYLLVPLLLIYSVAVVDEIVFDLMPDNKQQSQLKRRKIFKRIIGKMLLPVDPENTSDFDSIFEELGKALNYDCESCGFNGSLNKTNFQHLFEKEDLCCSQCNNTLLNTADSIETLSSFMDVIISHYMQEGEDSSQHIN